MGSVAPLEQGMMAQGVDMGSWALGSQGDWAGTGTTGNARRHSIYIQSGKSGPSMEDASIFS